MIAETLQRKLGATLFEIRPARAYPADYEEHVAQEERERQAGFEPPLAAKVEDIATYDEIFLGLPIWGTTAPGPIRSFLKAHELAGKRLCPFITHGGYGVGSAPDVIASHAPRSRIEPAFVVETDQERRTLNEITGWLGRIQSIGSRQSGDHRRSGGLQASPRVNLARSIPEPSRTRAATTTPSSSTGFARWQVSFPRWANCASTHKCIFYHQLRSHPMPALNLRRNLVLIAQEVSYAAHSTVGICALIDSIRPCAATSALSEGTFTHRTSTSQFLPSAVNLARLGSEISMLRNSERKASIWALSSSGGIKSAAPPQHDLSPDRTSISDIAPEQHQPIINLHQCPMLFSGPPRKKILYRHAYARRPKASYVWRRAV